MEFLHPEFLYYMLVPLLILFGLLLTQKGSQATFFSKEVMDKLRVLEKTLTLRARNALFALIGVLMLIALAEPVIPEGTIEVKAKSADIMIALDISDSMLAEDLYPNRLKLAKQKALELLRLAPNERIGVIAFAKNSYLVSPLSFDHDAVSFLLRQLSTDSITEKGTDFLSMLKVVDKSVKKESKKYLLILSDGGDSEDFSREIAYAKEKNISIFVLGVASKNGAPIKLANGEFIKQNGDVIISKLNPQASALATKTGGVFIQSVNSTSDVEAMLSEIEAHSEQKELKSKEIARFIPLFYFPLGLALLLLFIATSSMSKRKARNLPSAFLLIALLGYSSDVNAGLLDFVALDAAKSAYESGDYNKSAEIYKEFAQRSKKAESYYNAANALYKQGKYEEALELYKKASFDDKESKAKNFANIGNSYAKQPNKENLRLAIQAYEDSLKLQEDKEVRENLEAVKKALEDEKKEEENQENEEGEEGEEGENQESGEQDKQDKNEKDEKSQEQKDSEQKDEDANSQEKSEQNEQENQKEEDARESEKDIEEKESDNELEELKSDENKTQTPQTNALPQEPQQMSDEEQQKWLEKLNQSSQSYLYRLNTDDSKQENSNEKPW